MKVQKAATKQPRSRTACLLALVSLGCATRDQRGVQPPAAEPALTSWNAFWRAKGVSPPPPRDFLDPPRALPKTVNLTGGRLDDLTVKKWVLADLRRGSGDSWASSHLRTDLVNADVLGPPGLNGTDYWIAEEQKRGTVALDCEPSAVVAAAVIAVPEDARLRIAWANLTDFVIVLVFRTSAKTCERLLPDHKREAIQRPRPAGTLAWQLDAGFLREDPAIGAIWYQVRGWRCPMDGTSELDEFCGLLHVE